MVLCGIISVVFDAADFVEITVVVRNKHGLIRARKINTPQYD